MQRMAYSKALEEQVGEQTVLALLFCTHDLDPEFFEQEILQVFLGNDLRHNRRTREVQLDLVIRERELPIDVFYEPQALVATEGSARLGWRRHAVRVARGRFHPKVVLALCADRQGRQSLVVCVASANLTRSSWWRNIECAEVVRVDDGQRHGYVSGLLALLDDLRQRKSSQGDAPALKAIRTFLRRQDGYINSSVNGRLVPRIIQRSDPLLETLLRVGGDRIRDAHLEIMAPFFDGSPQEVVTRLTRWRDDLGARSVRVALPGGDGCTTLSEEVYDAVAGMRGVSWAALPTAYVKAADGEDATDRSLHAKVYRLWRGKPDPLEVLVLGSHNLTRAAQSGNNNWEVSAVVEPEKPYLARFLEDRAGPPSKFLMHDDDLGDDVTGDVVDVPLSLVYDWKGAGTATVTWLATTAEKVTLLRAGRVLLERRLPSRTLVELSESETRSLAEALTASSLLTCRREDGREGVVLCEELNHDLKPDLLDGLHLTAADVFALWSIDGLDERIRRIAGTRATVDADEDDLELAADIPGVGSSMFERFAGVFHAFGSLRARVDAAMSEGNVRRAGRAVYSQQFDSPYNALRIMRDKPDRDAALAYVTWCCARQLDHDLATAYPALVDEFADARVQLVDMLGLEAAIRQELIDAGDVEMPAFLDWFDAEFAGEGNHG